MVRIKFFLSGTTVPFFISPYKPCVTFSFLFHSFTLGLYIVLGLVFHKGKFY